MLRNYLKIALRNLWKSKAFSAINIVGLSAGLAVCLLIVLYVKDELSYDTFNPNAANIYRVDADIFFNGTQFSSIQVPSPMAPALKKDFPQVVEVVRFRNYGDIRVRKDNQNILDHHSVYADSTFFRVFPFPVLAGDPLTALNEPNSIVIDESTARKYFQAKPFDVVGKTLFINNATNCKVTAVIKDMPAQSHFHWSFIRPLRDTWHDDQNDWLSNNYASYILVRPGTTQAALQRAVDATVDNYLLKQLYQVLHASAADMKKGGNHFLYHTMPLTDIHLHSNKTQEFEANGDISYVYIFSVIAILILLIACVNFMNLSTARSANRAKEVGIRKVAGSLRSHLIVQFLTESVLVSFFSLLLALAIAALLLPLFNQLAGKEMRFLTLLSSWTLPLLILLILIVGCVAGSYPAFYLSSFQPVQVLKGQVAKGFKGSWLRSGLVVFQFFISITLIIGTIVIYNQLNHIRSRQLGYDRSQVLIIKGTGALDKGIKTFREDMLKISGVQMASIAGSLPTESGFDENGWFKEATLDAKEVTIMTDFYGDQNYIPTMGMQMVAGRNFSLDFPTDSSAIVINETAARLLGFKNPLNENLYRPYGNGPDGKLLARPYHIIGVVKDFNFSTMHNKVGPLIIELSENWGKVVVRINTKNIPALIRQVESKWRSMAPSQPFSYSFMDADFNKMYNADQRTGKLFISFALFAIFIACLGLFGLVTYAAEQRVKEIGVRKVLGASIGGIVVMLSKDFVKLVLIASFIAFPVAWFMMNKWLQGFAYRVNISWWEFVLAGLIALLIAMVSLPAVKAAVANPVKSLRTE